MESRLSKVRLMERDTPVPRPAHHPDGGHLHHSQHDQLGLDEIVEIGAIGRPCRQCTITSSSTDTFMMLVILLSKMRNFSSSDPAMINRQKVCLFNIPDCIASPN